MSKPVPEIVYDDDFFYRLLTREVLVEKIPFKIKKFILEKWTFRGDFDFSKNLICKLCLKRCWSTKNYIIEGINIPCTVCSKCCEKIDVWEKYINKTI